MYKTYSGKFYIAMVVLTMLIIITACTISGVNRNGSSDQWHEIIEGMHTATLFNTVHVSSDVFAIHFEPSSDELTHINLNSAAPDDVKKYFKLNIKEKNDQLNISIKGKKKNLGLSQLNVLKNTELTIQLPDEAYTKITIDSNVGSIVYGKINTAQLDVSSEVGHIEINDTNTSQMNIKSSAGSIKLHNTSGKMNIQDNLGAVHLTVPSIEDDINIKTDVGHVTIDTEHQPEHFRLDLSTDIGKVSTNWQANYDKQTAKTVKGRVGKNGPQVKVRTSIGNIDLK